MNNLQFTKLRMLIGQMIRFGLVGGLAGLVHFCVALLASHYISLLVANCLGFMVAFWVSFFGHYYFSFQVKHAISYHAVKKFVLVAVTGFLLNQSIVAGLEHLTDWQNGIILWLAIVLTAAVTFLLSRWYAFE